MILDLEIQERVHGLDRFRIPAGNLHPAPTIHVLEHVGDFAFQPLHDRDAGGRLIMYEHGSVEIPGREHHGNVAQVTANRVPAFQVFGVVGFNFNGSAVLGEPEMMGGLLMGEAHGVIAAADDAAVVIGRLLAVENRCD